MPAIAHYTASAILLATLTVSGCGGRKSDAPIVPGGNAGRGKVAIREYGCGSCHTIPGIRGARGLVGPSLAGTGQRMYIAGVLANDPENIVRWILNPPAVDPRTAMPALGVTEAEARDMAEYIYQLSRRARKRGG
jgi:cytochrome c1